MSRWYVSAYFQGACAQFRCVVLCHTGRCCTDKDPLPNNNAWTSNNCAGATATTPSGSGSSLTTYCCRQQGNFPSTSFFNGIVTSCDCGSSETCGSPYSISSPGCATRCPSGGTACPSANVALCCPAGMSQFIDGTGTHCVGPYNGGWSAWSACSSSTGLGTQTRLCNNPTPATANGGTPCQGPSSQSCGTAPPPPPPPPPVVNGGWTDWSVCPLPCGTAGSSLQTRTCTNPAPSGGGATCSGASSQLCYSASCPRPSDGGGGGGGGGDTSPKSASAGTIAGAVVGSVLGVSAIAAAGVFFWKRRRAAAATARSATKATAGTVGNAGAVEVASTAV